MGSTGVITEAVILRAVFFVGEASPGSAFTTAFDRTASKSRDVWNAWYASGCTASRLNTKGTIIQQFKFYAFYYVASVLTACFGPYIRPSSGEFTKY
jgi:hypothetical protein